MSIVGGHKKYVTARRIVEINFPDDAVNCSMCRYAKQKLGHYEDGGKMKSYSNYICVLTYSPIADPHQININCPLIFEEENDGKE